MEKYTKYVVVVLVVIMVGVIIFFTRKALTDYRNAKLIENATVVIELTKDMSVSFNSKRKLSEFIENINGEIIEDKFIETDELGSKTVEFEYINEDGIKIPYKFEVEVVDDVAPIVWLGSSYSVNTNFKGSLEEKIMCADDYDDEPSCKIEGKYDTTKVGSYSLNYVAEDSSGNKTTIPFTLKVTAPSSGSSNYVQTKYDFDDAKSDLGGVGVKFGIDVSSWQGDIDFEKVKNAGVEFAFVRVGSKWGRDKDFFLDSRFDRNMEGFNKAHIPVGAYFYSYAKNEKEAKEEAEWLISYLKRYKVDLPVAFDFEDWGNYNEYKMSLYRLNKNAEVFIETLESAGYEGMLYGSLNYLNKLWDTENKTVWVAHYTKKADYRGKYRFWQFSSAGRVEGIPSDVDLDIMYE